MMVKSGRFASLVAYHRLQTVSPRRRQAAGESEIFPSCRFRAIPGRRKLASAAASGRRWPVSTLVDLV